MEITLFGIIWIAILIFLLLFKPIDKIVNILIISTIFQATSVINIEEKGINPMIVTELFLLIKYIITYKKNGLLLKWNKMFTYLFLFIIYSVFISILAVFLFNGTESSFPIYNINNTVSFKYDLDLLVKVILIIMHFITIIIIYNIKNIIDKKHVFKTMQIAIFIVVFIGFWEFSSKSNLIPIKFPVSLIYNNVGYVQLYNQGSSISSYRLNSTFLEPSYCGCFLAASFWWLIASKQKENYILSIFVAIALVLNRSGTGIVSFVITGAIFLLFNRNIKIFISCIVLSIITLSILYSTGYLNQLTTMVVEKLDSQSGIERNHFNETALLLLRKTKFLGGGLASYRASSFWFNLLGTTGIIGCITFTMFLFEIYRMINYKKDNIYRAGALLLFIGIMVASFLAIPDINNFSLWMVVFYAILISERKKINEKN